MNNNDNSLDAYLEQIGKQKRLSDDEERQLAAKIQQGDKRALNQLTAANLTYVVTVAAQYRNRGLDFDDLVSEGNIGLMRAAARFDGEKGKRFVTFAAPYIRQAIEQAIEQQAGLYRVPRDVKDPAGEKRRSRALSIDAPIGGSNELSLGKVIPDDNAEDPARTLEGQAALQALQQAVAKLDARSRHVVQRCFGIGAEKRTMAETAQELGLKRERVRQIRNQAVRQLHRLTKGTDIKQFLQQ